MEESSVPQLSLISTAGVILNISRDMLASVFQFVVATVCLKALLECDSWTAIIVFSCFGSIILWFIFLAVYSVVSFALFLSCLPPFWCSGRRHGYETK